MVMGAARGNQVLLRINNSHSLVMATTMMPTVSHRALRTRSLGKASHRNRAMMIRPPHFIRRPT
jgi:hypothetical protein